MNKTKHPLQSKTIWGSLMSLFGVVYFMTTGESIEPADLEAASDHLFEIAAAVSAVVGLLMTWWGRATAKKPLGNVNPLANVLIAAFCVAILTGCTAQRLNTESVTATGQGHSSHVFSGDSITSHTSDGTPNYGITDDSGLETFSEQPGALLSMGRTGGHVATPGDISLNKGTLRIFNEEGGKVIELDIEGLVSNKSDPIEADASKVALLTDYAKALSEDERAKFIGVVESLSPVIGTALRAALGGG